MTQPLIAVTGFGVISPLGRGPEETESALREGKAGIVSQRPYWQELGLRSQVSGKIEAEPLREQFSRKENRFLCEAALLSAVAFKDAVAHARLSDEEVHDPRTGIVIGSGAGASMPDAVALADRLHKRGGSKVGAYQVPLIMGSSITANIGSLFRVRGHSYSVTSACSTSAHAIMMGLDLIRCGRQDRVFVGGGEDINIFCAAAFDGMQALSSDFNDTPEKASRPLDKSRDGFVVSGGAGVIVLERLDLAKSRNANIIAILRGASATCDGEDMVQPNGVGAETVMRQALEDAGVTADQIDYINLHGTSTPIGDKVEIESIRKVYGNKVPSFSSTKSMTGHGLGAAGAQEAIFTLLMMAGKFMAPNINLDDPDPIVGDLPVVRKAEDKEIGWAMSNSFGFGGTNCALVFGHPGAAG